MQVTVLLPALDVERQGLRQPKPGRVSRRDRLPVRRGQARSGTREDVGGRFDGALRLRGAKVARREPTVGTADASLVEEDLSGRIQDRNGQRMLSMARPAFRPRRAGRDLPWKDRSTRATLERRALTSALVQRGHLVIRKGRVRPLSRRRKRSGIS